MSEEMKPCLKCVELEERNANLRKAISELIRPYIEHLDASQLEKLSQWIDHKMIFRDTEAEGKE